MNIWFDELKEKLTESEIKKGDIVYISSDLTMLMYRSLKKFNLKGKDGKNLFMNKLVNTFQDMVGDEGTLMIPLFTCDGIVDPHTFMDYLKEDLEDAYRNVQKDWKRYEEDEE